MLYRLPAVGESPSPRSSPAAAAIDGDVYVFGGMHDDFRTGACTCHDDLYRLDTVGDTWKRLEPEGRRPAPRAYAAAVADENDGRLYVFGGCAYDRMERGAVHGYVAYGDLWVYDVAGGRWESVFEAAGGPTARAGASMWLHHGRLLLFGGADQQYRALNDMWVFELATRTWQPWAIAEPVPPPRCFAVSAPVPVRGRLIVSSGERLVRDNGGAMRFPVYADTWALDLRDGVWEGLSSRSPHSPVVTFTCVAAIRDHLHIYGGDVPGGTNAGTNAPFAQLTTNDAWCLSPDGRWRPLAPTGDRPKLKRHVGVAVGDRMYMLAGFDFVHSTDGGPKQVWNHDTYVYEPWASSGEEAIHVSERTAAAGTAD